MMFEPRVWLAVATGGALGASMRYLVSSLWGQSSTPVFPWPTWIVNIVGSLLLGYLLGLVVSERFGSPTWRLFWTTGFCGALTTFSTFSAEGVAMMRQGQFSSALIYVVTSVIICFVASACGFWGGTRL